MINTNTSQNGSGGTTFSALWAAAGRGIKRCPNQCGDEIILDEKLGTAYCPSCNFFTRRADEKPAPAPKSDTKSGTNTSQQVAAAKAFAAQYRDAFVSVNGQWLAWNKTEGLWLLDELKNPLAAVREDWPQYSLFWARAVLTWAATAGLLIRRVRDMDADPHIVACGAGKVMRVDGQQVRVESARADMYLSKKAGAPPDANPDRAAFWKQCVMTWTGGDEAYARALQRMAGCALFGQAIRHRLVTFLEGKQESGKSVFTNVLLAAFGSYGASAGDIFNAWNKRDQELKLGVLPGLRLATISDFGGRQQLNSSLLKIVSGGDLLQGRKLNHDPFDFHATCWILGASNELPAPDQTDAALKSRLRVLPFEANITQKDRGLTDRLCGAYLGAVVEWCRRGYEQYLQAGKALEWPKTVAQRTDEFYARIDPFQGWLNECCQVGEDDLVAPSRALFESYNTWRELDGLKPLAKERTFYDELTRRGFKAKRERFEGKIHVCRLGLELKSVTDVTDIY